MVKHTFNLDMLNIAINVVGVQALPSRRDVTDAVQMPIFAEKSPR